MSNIHSVLIVVICAVVTFLLRALPFVFFRKGKKTPPFVIYLGKVLPAAMMGMMVIYCFKGTSFLQYPYGIPEVVAAAVVVVLQVLRRNSLISIIAGTACYMFLIQIVF